MGGNNISAAELTQDGAKLFASAWGFDSVHGKMVFRGVTFTGGGARIMPPDGLDGLSVGDFLHASGKVTNVACFRNQIRVIVRYEGSGLDVQAFSLHSVREGKPVVFAVCRLEEPVRLNASRTVCFSFAMKTDDEQDLPLSGSGDVTSEQLGALSDDMKSRIDAVSERVTALEDGFGSLGQGDGFEEIHGKHLYISKDAEIEAAVVICLSVSDLRAAHTDIAQGHVGRMDRAFSSVNADIYTGRKACEATFGMTRSDTVLFPIGDGGKSVQSDDAPDAMFRTIASTSALSSKSVSSITLQGHSTERGKEEPRIVMKAEQDGASSGIDITHGSVIVSGGLEAEDVTFVNMTARRANIGYVEINGNFISVPRFNGAEIGTLDTTGVNPLNVQARVLPSGSRAAMGSSEKRWNAYTGMLNTEEMKFSTLPKVTGQGNTREASFPVGCLAMLCLSTRSITAGDTIDGSVDMLLVWSDNGGGSGDGIIRTKGRFVALSCAVAGRPFLAQRI